LVTQTISVTNTMLGTKNLMLKVKASFTSKGTKVEHTTTCSGFPAGQY
jgi:AP-1 complex subunit gamma-1